MSIDAPHDLGFKSLFSHPELVRNLVSVAALFHLERPRSRKEITDLIGLLAEWLKHQPDLARAFSLWISATLHHNPLLRGLIQPTENLLEIKSMLSKHDPWARWAQEHKAEGELLGLQKGMERGIEQGFEQGMEKGMEKGMEEGMEKGVEKGQIEAVLFLLDTRFAPLPDWVASRVLQASKSQLQTYLTGVLTASSLDALFEGPDATH